MVTKESILLLCRDKCLGPEDLYGAVRIAASKIASDTNHGGLEAQIDFLIEQFSEAETFNNISNLLGND